MSTIVDSQTAESGPVTEWLPPPGSVYRLSVEQYEAMVLSGVFTKHDRLHLINGMLECAS
jgi:hypothetical protein